MLSAHGASYDDDGQDMDLCIGTTGFHSHGSYDGI
jgi:hypothetical protein